MHDGFLGEFDRWHKEGFGVIAPSRPGYARTPLSSGPKYPQQADACAALLDHLGVKQVIIYALSGGGPCAINLAARHPDKVKALILECATTGDWDDPRRFAWYSCCFKFAATSVLMARFLNWCAAKYPWFFMENIMMPGLSTFSKE